jgi:hypothetical protein
MATVEQVRELVEKLHEERASLVATLKEMSEEQAELRQPERDGEAGWSVKEQLVHVAWQDTSYRGWVERARTEETPAIDYPPVTLLGTTVGTGRTLGASGGGESLPHYLELAHRYPLRELLGELERQRARTMLLIADLTLSEFDRRVRSSVFGEMTSLQVLRSDYRHERQHRAQILGEQSDYQPRWLAGAEPDQRLRP